MSVLALCILAIGVLVYGIIQFGLQRDLVRMGGQLNYGPALYPAVAAVLGELFLPLIHHNLTSVVLVCSLVPAFVFTAAMYLLHLDVKNPLTYLHAAFSWAALEKIVPNVYRIAEIVEVNLGDPIIGFYVRLLYVGFLIAQLWRASKAAVA